MATKTQRQRHRPILRRRRKYHKTHKTNTKNIMKIQICMQTEIHSKAPRHTDASGGGAAPSASICVPAASSSPLSMAKARSSDSVRLSTYELRPFAARLRLPKVVVIKKVTQDSARPKTHKPASHFRKAC